MAPLLHTTDVWASNHNMHQQIMNSKHAPARALPENYPNLGKCCFQVDIHYHQYHMGQMSDLEVVYQRYLDLAWCDPVWGAWLHFLNIDRVQYMYCTTVLKVLNQLTQSWNIEISQSHNWVSDNVQVPTCDRLIFPTLAVSMLTYILQKMLKKQNWLQFLFLVKATGLRQQISKFYRKI